MQIEIQGRIIKSDRYTIGTQGENNVESVVFCIPKMFGEVDLSEEGTQYILYGLTANNQEIVKKLSAVLEDEILKIKWEVGFEETQDVGLIYIAIHFNTAFDSVMKTEPAIFEVKSTINVQSTQPIIFSSRFPIPLAVEPDKEAITVTNKKLVIPASVQILAVQGDNENRKINIDMPKYYRGEDLSRYSSKLQANTSGGTVTIPLTFTDNGSSLTAIWLVERPVTEYAGKVELQLQIGNVGTDTFYDQTEIASVNVLPSLNYVPLVPVSPPEFDEYLRQIQLIKTQAQIAEAGAVIAKNIAETRASEASASAILASEEVTKAKTEVANAKDEATKASEFATNAQNSATSASASLVDSNTAKTQAQESAVTSKNEADRAKSEADRASQIVGNLGYFATPQALQAAHPIGTNGQFAIVGTTDTIWVWDSDLKVWFNSQSTGLQNDYNLLVNKPTIENVSLVENVTLEEIGVVSKVEFDGHAKDKNIHTSAEEKAAIETRLTGKASINNPSFTGTATLNGKTLATTEIIVAPITPLNGFEMSGNKLCKLSDCGALKLINAELMFVANVPAGTTIFYTGIIGSYCPVICSIFDSYCTTFLGQIIGWHYSDGRLVNLYELNYNTVNIDNYNILQINAAIGG